MTDQNTKTLAEQHRAGRAAVQADEHAKERRRIEARIDRERSRLAQVVDAIEQVNENLQTARGELDEAEDQLRKATAVRNEALDKHRRLAGRLASMRGSRKAVSGAVHQAEQDLQRHQKGA